MAKGYEGKLITRSEGKGPDASLSGWLKTFAALAAVIVLIFLLRLLLGRLGRLSRPAARGDAVEVLARSELSPRCQLFLLRLGRRLLLVGVGADRPATLCEIADPTEIAEVLAGLGKADAKGSHGPHSDSAVRDVSQKIMSRLSSWQKDQS